MRQKNKVEHKEKFHITKGQYKGLGLFLESNATTRPTKALIKKSFFDSMYYNLRGKVFVECFAGSGQMGFEALSLGARGVVFFETNSNAFMNLSSNIALFKQKAQNYTNTKQQDNAIQAYQKDCLQSLEFFESSVQDSYTNTTNNTDFIKNASFGTKNAIMQDNFVFYMDPPFPCREGFHDIYMRVADFIESFSLKLSQKVDIIVIESMSTAYIDTQIGAFKLYKKSKFGQTTLLYFTK